ncbi:unnamed protein product [Adineta steineri]|uniref:G-protein coupled receptors family 1 profile domain-containing protein n=1 Tax=Adineta steineri TaxID=433720 RepID=A0A818NB28_9BILA|nr:unnamed protein product [Adineta steineri]CAF3603670.1 unnamed protein product [Adineta steineri]
MTTSETLNYISQQLNIYLGIAMFILGIIGSLWNMLIFRHYYFRLSSCCIYMLAGSIASLIQLIFGLLIRILSEGFNIDLDLTNIAWCKIRNYITYCASLTALSCFVWTSIDRYLSTCRQIKWRLLNSLFVAKQICLLTIILWMLINIPTLVYMKPIHLIKTCTSSSIIWSNILIYFINLFCYGIFPWVFMSIFGILTLRNLRHIHHQRISPISAALTTRMTRIDHQLTSILFSQIIISMISSIPYLIQIIYANLTRSVVKDTYRQAQENLYYQIVCLTFYLNYVSMFYVNYISSTIFRRLSRKVLINLFKKKEDVSKGITLVNHQRNNKQSRHKKLKIFTTHFHRTTSIL